MDYDSDSLESVRLNAPHLDQVIVFGYGFDWEGNAVGKDQTLIRGVTSRQKRVLLFGNFSDAGFDPDLAHRILTDPVVQERAMSSMLAEAEPARRRRHPDRLREHPARGPGSVHRSSSAA